MSTYKATITYRYADDDFRQYTCNVIANSIVGATTLAMDNFFYVMVGEGEIEKIVVELRQSTRRVTGDLK